MIAAAIDIGTNSVKLIIARREGEALAVLYSASEVTRLGRGVDGARRLAPDAIARTLAALEHFASAAREHGAERIEAVGTSALRDAANAGEFVAAARVVLGADVTVISGEREARLTYLAARYTSGFSLSESALLATTDVGGGSTEIVLGEGEAVRWARSLDLGAVRLTERVGPADPWRESDIARAVALADGLLATLDSRTVPELVVASGGTATNLASVAQGGRDEMSIHGFSLSVGELEGLVRRLGALTLAERHRVPGLEPARADVIVAGAIVQWRALAALGTGALLVSTHGLRYGLLRELLFAYNPVC